MRSDDRFFVVSGTRSEYADFVVSKTGELIALGHTSISLSNFVWLNDPDKLRGLRNPHGWFIGTWYNLANIQSIVDMLILTTDNVNNSAFGVAYPEIVGKLIELKNQRNAVPA